MAKKLSQTVKGYEGTLDANEMRAMFFAQRKGYEPDRTALQDPPGPNLRPRYSIVERDQPSKWFKNPQPPSL